ncbi:cytochrome P450 4C1-like [Venturia canescens]|uniref:cytochrome P450 4C1-like n=1 Tax=Venturia canescens TaxID=32260 RepID=UPI001C9BC656|nr:cytochrome P450 4C1-like [Venturia canescens]
MIVNLLLFASVLGLVLYLGGKRCYEFYVFRKKMKKIPSPTYKFPLFGMILELLTVEKKDRLDWFEAVNNRFKDGIICTWLGTTGTVHIRKPEYLETILRSTTEITKSDIYHYLMPWLGNGLLTSTGTQWQHARKLLTPAFHFKILEEFSEIMIDKAKILTDCLEREMKIHGDKPFDIFELCVKAALDIICETAMGVDVHAQEAVHSEYIDAIHTISEAVTYRFFRPWLKPDIFFYQTAMGKKFKKAVETTHDLCTQVIQRKQQERKHGIIKNDVSEGSKIFGERKRRAFLDLMLEANELESNPMTIQEIIDQTSTFMFAGHDTTGALVNWTLFCLGIELDVQKKVHDELDEVLGDADDRTTLEKLPNLKYLERVIKETLRMYPSATSVSRSLVNDLQIGEYTIPKDARVNLLIYNLHRNAEIWPDPLRFDPDRFLPENVKNRHPYAYIPFSAGLRNCIGQKYAMLEAKLTLAQVLRKFSFKSVENHDTIKKYSEIILRPVEGTYVYMKKRADG